MIPPLWLYATTSVFSLAVLWLALFLDTRSTR